MPTPTAYILLLLFLFPFLAKGQDVGGQTENRLNRTLSTAENLLESHPDSARTEAEKALEQAIAVNDSNALHKAHSIIAQAYFNRGSLRYSINTFNKALLLSTALSDSVAMVSDMNWMSNAYEMQGNYDSALHYHFQSLAIAETLNDLYGQSSTLNGIGNVYEKLEDFPKALRYYEGAIELAKQIENLDLVAALLNNIGVIKERQKHYQEALGYYQQAMDFYQQTQDSLGLSIGYNNIGAAHLLLKQFDKAFENQTKAIGIQKAINDQYGLSYSYREVAKIYMEIEQWKAAKIIIESGIEIANKLVAGPELLKSYQVLIDILKKDQQWESVANYQEKYYSLKDSLLDAEKERKIQRLEILRTESENEALRKQNRLQETELELQSTALNQQIAISALAALALLSTIVISWVIYYNRQKLASSNRSLKEQNLEIQRQNDEIQVLAEELTQQKEEVMATNELLTFQKDSLTLALKELNFKNALQTDSLRAAQRVQNSMLPQQDIFSRNFSDHFILNRPKDMVSGDFYWIKEVNEQLLMAVGDCTGHGVTGALMTAVGITLLDKLVLEDRIYEPAELLEKLHQEVRSLLRSEQTGQMEGMDIALLNFTQKDRLTLSCKMASAKRPVLLCGDQNNWTEWKGDRKTIGGFIDFKRSFQPYEFEVRKGNRLYLFTDGITDQHNPARQKFGYERLKQILSDCQKMSMPLQLATLEQTLDNHQQASSQRDDILVVGIEF